MEKNDVIFTRVKVYTIHRKTFPVPGYGIIFTLLVVEIHTKRDEIDIWTVEIETFCREMLQCVIFF